MPTVAEVQKLLEDKTKALQKVIPAIAKQETLVEGLEKQVKALDATAKQKKDKPSKEALTKAQGVLKVEQTKLDNLVVSRDTAQEAIAALNKRVRALTVFVESREGFLKWWDKEEGKMMALVDAAQESAGEAEDESKKAEEAMKGGDLQAGQAAAQKAQAAAQKTTAKVQAADVLYKSWSGTWDGQRNLKSSDLPKADVESYAALTKKVYDIFRLGQNLNASAKKWDVEATKSASSAAEFVADGGDMVKTYEKMLDATILSMQAISVKFKNMTGITWGKAIMEDGKLFKTMLSQYNADKDGKRVAAQKMVEQAGPLVDGYLVIGEKAVANLDQQASKTLGRIGRGFQGQLSAKINAMQQILKDARKLYSEFEKHYAVAIVAFNDLKNAVG